MLLDLPDELLDLVLEKCPAKTLARLQCVCKALQPAVQRAPKQLHLTQSNAQRVLEWVEHSPELVTKLSMRRLFPNQLLARIQSFCNLRIVDVQFVRIQWYDASQVIQALPHLHTLRLRKISTYNYTFKLSWLPHTLQEVDLIFERPYYLNRIELDDVKNIQKLRIQSYGRPYMYIWEVAPNTSLITQGEIYTMGDNKSIDAIDLELECSNDDVDMLQAFKSISNLTLCMPRATVCASELRHLNLHTLDADVRDFVTDCDLGIEYQTPSNPILNI